MTDDVNAAREKLLYRGGESLDDCSGVDPGYGAHYAVRLLDLWTSPEHRDDLLRVLGFDLDVLWSSVADEERARAERAEAERDEARMLLKEREHALLDEIDALKDDRAQWQAQYAHVTEQRDRYREALKEIADALPSNGLITVRSIASRALSKTGEQKP